MYLLQDETYAEAANSVNNSGKGMVVSVSEKLHDYNWAPRRSSFGEKRARTPQNTFANSACALPGLGFGERQGGAEFNDNSKVCCRVFLKKHLLSFYLLFETVKLFINVSFCLYGL